MANTWATGDSITAAKLNQQTAQQLTGAEIAALSPTYAGQLVVCTSTGGGFTVNRYYYRNAANGAWLELAELAETQTLTNKTVNATNNTITDSSTAAGDLLKSDGTKFARFAKGSAHYLLRTNSGATDLEYAAGLSVLGTTTLGSNGATLEVTGLTAKKHYLVMALVKATNVGSSSQMQLRFNGDSGANYSSRRSDSGAAETTSLSAGHIIGIGTFLSFSSGMGMTVFWVNNRVTGDRKPCLGMAAVEAGSAATAPTRSEFSGAWSNTAAQITQISLIAEAAKDQFASGSEITVYGWD